MLLRLVHTALACVAVLTLVACGDDGALKVQGDVAVELAADRVERYPFPNAVLLQPDYELARAQGVFAGRCTLTEGSAELVETEVARPSAMDGLTSFRVVGASGGGGSVVAVVDGIAYSGDSSSGVCGVQTIYADFDDRAAGLEIDCQLDDGSGGSARAVGDLHYSGCAFVGGD